jgi:hypothetical protein
MDVVINCGEETLEERHVSVKNANYLIDIFRKTQYFDPDGGDYTVAYISLIGSDVLWIEMEKMEE